LHTSGGKLQQKNVAESMKFP